MSEILTVAQKGEDILKIKATPVTASEFGSDWLLEFANALEATMLEKNGVGIAAPQVGINRNIIWAKRFDKQGNPLEYFINPKILWRSEVLNFGPEGDLSIEVFRDYFYRSQVIQLEYFDLFRHWQREQYLH